MNITLPRATVQAALDAYEVFRDRDDIETLDKAMSDLDDALKQPDQLRGSTEMMQPSAEESSVVEAQPQAEPADEEPFPPPPTAAMEEAHKKHQAWSEAQKLADAIGHIVMKNNAAWEAAAELRRLEAANRELLEACKNLLHACHIAGTTGMDIDNARIVVQKHGGTAT